MFRIFVILALSVSTPANCFSQDTKTKDEPAQEMKSAQTAHALEVEKDTKIQFLKYLPENYSKAGKKWPLMIFLHGRGESGDELEIVKRWGPPRIVETKPDFPFVLISPQCPDGSKGHNTKHIKKLIDDTIKNHNIETDRVYLTGLSMGGYGSWKLAAEHPDFFAAVAPICGGGKPKTAEKLKDVSIWAFHGDKDSVVPLSQTTNITDAIKEAGGKKIKVTIYEEVGHNSWQKAYADQELYKWLLSHKRKSKAKGN